MPTMATMAMATVTPTMVMATAMASPTGDRCIQREKERRKSCDVEFCFPVKMSDNYQKYKVEMESSVIHSWSARLYLSLDNTID